MDSVIEDRGVLVPSWASSRKFESGSVWFHGSGARFDGAIRGGGDGVLWFADSSVIAQNYIPKSAGMVLYCAELWNQDYTVAPPRQQFGDSVEFTVATQMGHRLKYATYDGTGALRSWAWEGASPTRNAVREYITSELGYLLDEYTGNCWISWKAISAPTEVGGVKVWRQLLPADYRMPGRLFVIQSKKGWNLLDVSTGEGDLCDPDYRKYDLFERAARGGYDGVIIDDFCQTDHHGNVGHVSLGLFRHTWPALEPLILDCRRFVIPERYEVFPAVTPEWTLFLNGK